MSEVDFFIQIYYYSSVNSGLKHPNLKEARMSEILGIDIGGVIIDRANDGTDTSFFSFNYLNTTAVEGAFTTIARLVNGKFGHHVHLVSKCGRAVEEKTRIWLTHHDFYRITGVSPGNVHFCRERADKHGICERLRVTHFIDDRLEVLSYLKTVPNRYLFQGRRPDLHRFSHVLPDVQCVEFWSDIENMLLKNF